LFGIKEDKVDFADICNSVANHIGFFAGKSRNMLSSAQKKLRESTNLPEKIRNAAFEKLNRMLYEQTKFIMTKLSERMGVINEVVGPFYERIKALAPHGPVTEGQLWQALNSIETAKKLTDEEKVLLVTLFGRIVGALKSKVVDAVVVEKSTQASAANKNTALSSKSGTN
jgi:hypothetical protein